jgi:arylsulfatase A-like enzyme
MAAEHIESPTSLIDIAPTILDFLGVPCDGLPGTSLVNLAQVNRHNPGTVSNLR